MTDNGLAALLAEFDGSVCPACHHVAHDPGSCEECPRCELHTDEALAFVLRYEPGLLRAEQDATIATLRAALDGLVAAATTFLANYDAVAESDDPMAAGAHPEDEEGWWITGAAALDDALDMATNLRAVPSEAQVVDNCIAIIQQSLDTVRAEDDGESRSMKMSIAAREHVIALLTGYRERALATAKEAGNG